MSVNAAGMYVMKTDAGERQKAGYGPAASEFMGFFPLPAGEMASLPRAREFELLLGTDLAYRRYRDLLTRPSVQSGLSHTEELRRLRDLMTEMFTTLFDSVEGDGYVSRRRALFVECHDSALTFAVVLYLHFRYLSDVIRELCPLCAARHEDFTPVISLATRLVFLNLAVAETVYDG